MNKKICKIVMLIVFLLGVCGIGTSVLATAPIQSNVNDTNTVSNAVVSNNETVNPNAREVVGNPIDNNQNQLDKEETKDNNNGSNNEGIGLIGAALATGLACIGAGIAVAVVASSAIGAISENPNLFGKTIIFAGLAEGIAIYGLIISIMILSKF